MSEPITPLADGRDIIEELGQDMMTWTYRSLVLTLLGPVFILQMGGGMSEAIAMGKVLSSALVLMISVWLLGPYILTVGAALLDKYGYVDYRRVIHG